MEFLELVSRSGLQGFSEGEILEMVAILISRSQEILMPPKILVIMFFKSYTALVHSSKLHIKCS